MYHINNTSDLSKIVFTRKDIKTDDRKIIFDNFVQKKILKYLLKIKNNA